MTETRAAITEFFRTALNVVVPGPDDDLIERGLLDSLGIVELLYFLESRFGLRADLATLELDQLSSVNAICRLVHGDAPASGSDAP